MTLDRKTPLIRKTALRPGSSSLKRIELSRGKSELKRSPFANRGGPLPRRREKRRKHVHDNFRKAYKESEATCELAQSFPIDPSDRRQSLIPWEGETGRNSWSVSLNRYKEPARECHHIFSGIQGVPRFDELWNLIHLSGGKLQPDKAHAWCERFANDGLTLCIREKMRKGEFDVARVEEVLGCGSARLGEWLSAEKHRPHWPFAVDAWVKLCDDLISGAAT